MTDAGKSASPRSFPAATHPKETLTGSASRPIVLLSSDLMLSVALDGPARAAGCTLSVIASPSELQRTLPRSSPALVVFDLADRAFSLPEAVRLVREAAPDAKLLAFYPHVRNDLASLARLEGCESLMPRSRFMLDPAKEIRAALAEP